MPSEEKVSGILSLKQGVMMPNGIVCKYIWHNDWIILKDGHAGVRVSVQESESESESEELIAQFYQHNIVGFVELAESEMPYIINDQPLYKYGRRKS